MEHLCIEENCWINQHTCRKLKEIETATRPKACHCIVGQLHAHAFIIYTSKGNMTVKRTITM